MSCLKNLLKLLNYKTDNGSASDPKPEPNPGPFYPIIYINDNINDMIKKGLDKVIEIDKDNKYKIYKIINTENTPATENTSTTDYIIQINKELYIKNKYIYKDIKTQVEPVQTAPVTSPAQIAPEPSTNPDSYIKLDLDNIINNDIKDKIKTLNISNVYAIANTDPNGSYVDMFIEYSNDLSITKKYICRLNRNPDSPECTSLDKIIAQTLDINIMLQNLDLSIGFGTGIDKIKNQPLLNINVFDLYYSGNNIYKLDSMNIFYGALMMSLVKIYIQQNPDATDVPLELSNNLHFIGGDDKYNNDSALLISDLITVLK